MTSTVEFGLSSTDFDARQVPLGNILAGAKVVKAGSTEYPLLSMTMQHGLVRQEDKFKKRVASRDLSQYKVVSSGQLVVGFPIDEGVLSFQMLVDAGIVSPAYGVWDLLNPDMVDRRYLETYLRSPRALSYYLAKLRGSTARRRSLPREVFLAMPVPLPPVDEQRRIAAILDKTDELRSKRHHALAQLDVLAHSIFHDMFGDPINNPMGWPIVRVGDALESAKYGSSEKAALVGATPVLRMNNLTYGGQLDLSQMKYLPGDVDEKYLVRSGDVLFNRTNSAELVGKTAVFTGPEPMAYAGYLVRLRTNASCRPHFLGTFMNLPSTKKTLRTMCKSIVGMANINAQEVQTIKMPLPPVEKQNDFEARLMAISHLKDHHHVQLRELDALFASLQHRAFQGEL